MNQQRGKLATMIFVVMTVVLSCIFFTIPSFARAGNSSSLLVNVNEYFFENTRNQKMWTKERSKRLAAISEVQIHIDKLNKGQFDDWRLPTKQELFDLFAIFDLKNNGDVKVRMEGKYWLADSEGQVSVGTWEIGEGCGPERRFYSGGKGYVRAVRP